MFRIVIFHVKESFFHKKLIFSRNICCPCFGGSGRSKAAGFCFNSRLQVIAVTAAITAKVIAKIIPKVRMLYCNTNGGKI